MTNAISATSYNPDVSSRLIQRIGTTPTPVLASQTVDPDEGVLKLSGETFLREHRAGSSGARLQAPLASGEVSVQRGHALVKQVCRDNRDDFDLLFNSLGPVWGEERFAAIERIAHDQECFNSILNRMTEPDRDSRYRAELEAGYHPFITGLKKLAGAQ